jgi:hypothetical protein
MGISKGRPNSLLNNKPIQWRFKNIRRLKTELTGGGGRERASVAATGSREGRVRGEM